MNVPEWVKDAVFYQIFPDRFADGDPGIDPANVQPWGTPPTSWGFQGGDLKGVHQRLDYLQDLGVTGLYFNPIFQSTSNHRYNTTDYYQIDPRLGTVEEFQALLREVHRRGMRLLLDGVFNHCGRGFFAFNDVLENESHSAYTDWFHIRRFPLNAFGPGDAENYQGWWKFKSLPKFNTDNPQVRRYLIDVGRHWVQQGIDGWRLDVPNEIDDDSFWAEFRQAVKAANVEAYLVGEIWDGDPRWVGPGHFDGLLQYPLRDIILAHLASGTLKPSEFARRAVELLSRYSPETTLAHYLPLGSHDTERLRTVCGRDVARTRLSLLFQFFYPGAPGIYYGDEIGLEGGRDPDSRRAFPWDESKWDLRLRKFVQDLISIRRRLTCLRRGQFLSLMADDASGSSVFARTFQAEAAVLALNASGKRQRLRVPVAAIGLTAGQVLHAAIGGQEVPVRDDHIDLELGSWEGILLHT